MTKQEILGGRETVKVAVAQISPAFLNPRESVDRAAAAIREAGSNGADLVVFPEVWLAGYPFWTEGWDSDIGAWAAGRLAWNDAAVLIGGELTERLSSAVREAGVNVVIGMNELDPRPGCQTVYNTLLFLDRDGHELGRNRKLNPTASERMFWGSGDARDLNVFETDIGRVGGLICGDNLTLSRTAMTALGAHIHVAVFPGSFVVHKGPQLVETDTDGLFWGHFVSQAHSMEAGAFVVCACGYLNPDDVPEEFPHREGMNVAWAQGGSAVYAPPGVPLIPPTLGPQIIYAELQAANIKVMKAIIDTLGHYSRPDVLELRIRGERGWRALTGERDVTARHVRSDLRRAADRYGVDEQPVEDALAELGQEAVPAGLEG